MKKYILGLITGIIIVGGIGVFAYAYNASQITYEPNDTNWNVKNVKAAIDDLKRVSQKAEYIKFSPKSNNIYAIGESTKKAVCINRNNKTSCFGINNYTVEKNHMQQVFSDIGCVSNDAGIGCYGTDFSCIGYPDGAIRCSDNINDAVCDINTEGVASCS